MKLPLLSLTCFLLTLASAPALVLYGGDNNTNITAPANGVPWEAVARVGNVSGSAVYIGNGYLLTANHVTLGSSVSFDGVNTFAIDQSSVHSFAGVDLKLFRLTEIPLIAGVSLLNTAAETSGGELTLIGWGKGRSSSSAVGDNLVAWGDGTNKKRWGLNTLSYTGVASGRDPAFAGVNYQVVAFDLDGRFGLGPNEAGLTQHDSGSGMFQFIDGQWYLVGIATLVASHVEKNSLFSDPLYSIPADINMGVRISSYYDEIMAQISPIPEPSTFALLISVAAGGACLAVRRKRQGS
ncbi:MAG TPA: PEP-CTERM sorting domain-containing protein [Chthoniobacteraceae bacterium]|nr:PEP-CTERM sorting domain-containing protein [Chthoniobacteraceae bacterium]